MEKDKLPAQIIDGKAMAAAVSMRVAEEVAALAPLLGRPPGLTVILVGADAASQVYVRKKQSASRAAGIEGRIVNLDAGISQSRLLEEIDKLNADTAVDGILVQLPIPKQIDERAVIERIDPLKDVDGFHPENVGLLALGQPRFVPCTPLGIMHMLKESGVRVRGSRAVVLGRSNIVGRPMSLLLLRKDPIGDATVTVCHTATTDPAALAREADILVVAMGRPEAVGADWVKPGAAVIDVGIHRRPDGSLCGDVRAQEVAQVAGWITPVPGGVGPMTVAMLLQNTVQAARLRLPQS